MTEIQYRAQNTPEAFVSKYLATEVGLNYRVLYPTFFDKDSHIWNITLQIVIPQRCECCKQNKPPIVQEGGSVKVRRNLQTYEYEFVEKNIKEPEQSSLET